MTLLVTKNWRTKNHRKEIDYRLNIRNDSTIERRRKIVKTKLKKKNEK